MKKDISEFKKQLQKNGLPSLGEVLRRRRRTMESFLEEKGVVDSSSAEQMLETLASTIQDVSFGDDFFEVVERLMVDSESKLIEKAQEITTQITLESETKKKKSKAKSANISPTPEDPEENKELSEPEIS